GPVTECVCLDNAVFICKFSTDYSECYCDPVTAQPSGTGVSAGAGDYLSRRPQPPRHYPLAGDGCCNSLYACAGTSGRATQPCVCSPDFFHLERPLTA